ncbi:MAG: ABC transporter ATP-binding protein [Chloroflexota bacterium]
MSPSLETPVRALTAAGLAAAPFTSLEVRGLKKHFIKTSILPWEKDVNIRAVDGVNFIVSPGQVVGLVGESGCGKTTLGRMLVRLEDPTEGEILFDGRDLARLQGKPLKEFRQRIQMIFQDPYSSLDPRMRIRESVAEPLTVNGIGTAAEQAERARILLEQVGLDGSFAERLPSQLSGGQRQRVVIARALALGPAIIVADEPTASLDVSVRAHVINLLRDLQQRNGLSFIYISHDLSTVRYICDTINVMYLGKIVEQAPAEELFQRPLHPYTQALLAAVPVPDPVLEAERPQTIVTGELPSPANPPPGCAFHTRCPIAIARCRDEAPELTMYGPRRSAACHLVE